MKKKPQAETRVRRASVILCLKKRTGEPQCNCWTRTSAINHTRFSTLLIITAPRRELTPNLRLSQEWRKNLQSPSSISQCWRGHARLSLTVLLRVGSKCDFPTVISTKAKRTLLWKELMITLTSNHPRLFALSDFKLFIIGKARLLGDRLAQWILSLRRGY